MPHDKPAGTVDTSGDWRKGFLKPLAKKALEERLPLVGTTGTISRWQEGLLKLLEERAREEELLLQEEAIALSCRICLIDNTASQHSFPIEKKDTPKEAAIHLLVKEAVAALTERARKAKLLTETEYLFYTYAVYRKPVLFMLKK